MSDNDVKSPKFYTLTYGETLGKVKTTNMTDLHILTHGTTGRVSKAATRLSDGLFKSLDRIPSNLLITVKLPDKGEASSESIHRMTHLYRRIELIKAIQNLQAESEFCMKPFNSEAPDYVAVEEVLEEDFDWGCMSDPNAETSSESESELEEIPADLLADLVGEGEEES